ncbi:MAG: ArnT family glycosyltransferase [Candidatus Promineifilaceae bacterium]
MNESGPTSVFVLAALILLASFLRLSDLDSLPPPLNDDEASNGLDALHLARGEAPALFYEANMGREPLHIYAQAAAIRLFAGRPWSLRFPSALAGILSVPIIYVLARVLFGQGRHSHQIALLATVLLVVSYWHLHLSRLAFRAIYMIPLLMLVIVFFWRGWQRGRFFDMVLAGVMLGLSTYTYLPARLMPLVILVFIFAQVLLTCSGRPVPAADSRSLLTAGAVMLVVSLLIFAPLGFYFIQQPGQFIGRSQDVSVVTAAHNADISFTRLLLENAWATARMFIDRGHQNPVLNMPGRPALNPLAAAGLLAGLAIALRRVATPSYMLLLIWLLVMLLPTVASDEPAHPLRAIGALPPALLLAAVGLQRGSVWLSRVTALRPSSADVLVLMAVLVIGGVSSYHAYFMLWAGRIDTRASFDVVEYAAGERIVELNQSESLLLTERTFFHPTTSFVLESSSQPAFKPGAPRRDLPVTLLYAPDTCRLSQKMILVQREPEGALTARQVGAYDLDVPAFLAAAEGESLTGYHVGQDNLFSLTGLPAIGGQARNALPSVVGANIADDLCLLAVDVTPAAAAPVWRSNKRELVTLTLYWEYLNEIAPQSIDGTVRLIAANGAELYRFPLSGFPGPRAGAGEPFATAYDFSLPAETDPGKYLLQLDIRTREGQPPGQYTFSGLLVNRDQHDPKEPVNPLEIVAGDPPLMRLIGYDVLPSPASLRIVLTWQALRPIRRDYTVFIHLYDQLGELRAQRDSEPMDGNAPTSWWLPHEIITDTHVLPLGTDLHEGNYALSLGLYYWQTGERLPLFDGSGQRLADDTLVLPALFSP